jgi:hypothetical protein
MVESIPPGRTHEPIARAYPAGVWLYLSSEAVANLRIFPFVGEVVGFFGWAGRAETDKSVQKPARIESLARRTAMVAKRFSGGCI